MVSGNRVVADVINSVKTWSYILEKSGLLIQFNWCPHEKREIWTQKVREENRWRLRDMWGEDRHVKTDTETGLSLSQTEGHLSGAPGAWRVKEGSFPEPLARAWPYQCLVFKCSPSKTVRWQIFLLFLSPLVSGTLLWRPSETNTDMSLVFLKCKSIKISVFH